MVGTFPFQTVSIGPYLSLHSLNLIQLLSPGKSNARPTKGHGRRLPGVGGKFRGLLISSTNAETNSTTSAQRKTLQTRWVNAQNIDPDMVRYEVERDTCLEIEALYTQCRWWLGDEKAIYEFTPQADGVLVGEDLPSSTQPKQDLDPLDEPNYWLRCFRLRERVRF